MATRRRPVCIPPPPPGYIPPPPPGCIPPPPRGFLAPPSPRRLLPPPPGQGVFIGAFSDFTIRLGSHCIPVRGQQLIRGPVYLVQRIPPTSLFLRTLDQLREELLPLLLPRFMQTWLQRLYPAIFLPPSFIVKELDPTHPDSFYREDIIYARLQHLQGTVIPMHYDIAEVEHPGSPTTTKAHLIELVTGIPLSECTMALSVELDFEAKINKALARLSERNVVQGDPEPRHFFHTEKGVRIIDFGEAYVDHNAEGLNEADARHAMHRFHLFAQGSQAAVRAEYFTPCSNKIPQEALVT